MTVWTWLRKLVRKRQESQAIRDARACAEALVHEFREEMQVQVYQAESKSKKALLDAEERISKYNLSLSELQQKLERKERDANERIQRLEADVQSYEKLQLPTLRNELKVAKLHIEELETLQENRRLTVDTLNAVLSQKLVESENLPTQTQAEAMRQLLRGDLGTTSRE